MDDIIRSNIEMHYQGILKHLENGKIYGESLDISDPKQLVVAAYFLGQKSWFHIDEAVPPETGE